MDAIDAYLNSAFVFYQEIENPKKILFSNHDVIFTDCYGARPIGIDDRPAPAPPAEKSTHNA